MKRLSLLLSLFYSLLLSAQVSKTVNNTTAGKLYSQLTSNERNTVTSLTVTGKINANDIYTMRDNMPLLAIVDLSGAVIEEYTAPYLGYFPANTIPNYAFCYKSTGFGKPTLSKIVVLLVIV